jgi:hypothetical protein
MVSGKIVYAAGPYAQLEDKPAGKAVVSEKQR